MKLRKQTRLKALITALTTGLFLLFLGLIRANPQIEAQANTAPPAATPDYDRFFVPSNSSSAGSQTQAPQPHTRTRAS